MSSGGFTLGDVLGLKVAACRVRGCTRTWTDLSSNPKFGDAGISDDTKGMCEACRRRWPKLVDREMPCAREGCDGTWHLSRQTQLENQAAGRSEGQHFCDSCDEKLKAFETVEIVCAVPDCGRMARLTPKQQLLGTSAGIEPQEGGVTISGALCKRCAEKGPYLKDVPAACGIHKCTRTWTWKADEQISAFASGKPNIAPRRMCETCRDSFGKLLDRDIRCRASGCKKTWLWTREQQLDACVADKPLPKPPSHLCEDCFKVWNGLKDEERPCRRSGCKNTWIEKRGAQLARALRGKVGDPFPQFCESCAGEVEHLKDREVGCKTEGCKRTWTWTAQQQFVAGVRPAAPPPLRETPAQVTKPADERLPGEAPVNRRRRRGGPGPVDAQVSSPEQQALPPADANTGEPVISASAEPEVEATSVVATVGEVQPAMEAAASSPQGENFSGDQDASSDDEGDDESEASPEGQAALEEVGQPSAPGKKKRRRRRRKSSIRPPSRHCGFCTQFLAKHKTVELPCASCGTPIFWPPESQLQTELGNWEIPKLCGACKRDATEADRQRAKQELIDQAPHALGRADSPDQAGVVAEAAPAGDATIATDVAPADAAPADAAPTDAAPADAAPADAAPTDAAPADAAPADVAKD